MSSTPSRKRIVAPADDVFAPTDEVPSPAKRVAPTALHTTSAPNTVSSSASEFTSFLNATVDVSRVTPAPPKSILKKAPERSLMYESEADDADDRELNKTVGKLALPSASSHTNNTANISNNTRTGHSQTQSKRNANGTQKAAPPNVRAHAGYAATARITPQTYAPDASIEWDSRVWFDAPKTLQAMLKCLSDPVLSGGGKKKKGGEASEVMVIATVMRDDATFHGVEWIISSETVPVHAIMRFPCAKIHFYDDANTTPPTYWDDQYAQAKNDAERAYVTLCKNMDANHRYRTYSFSLASLIQQVRRFADMDVIGLHFSREKATVTRYNRTIVQRVVASQVPVSDIATDANAVPTTYTTKRTRSNNKDGVEITLVNITLANDIRMRLHRIIEEVRAQSDPTPFLSGAYTIWDLIDMASSIKAANISCTMTTALIFSPYESTLETWQRVSMVPSLATHVYELINPIKKREGYFKARVPADIAQFPEVEVCTSRKDPTKEKYIAIDIKQFPNHKLYMFTYVQHYGRSATNELTQKWDNILQYTDPLDEMRNFTSHIEQLPRGLKLNVLHYEQFACEYLAKIMDRGTLTRNMLSRINMYTSSNALWIHLVRDQFLEDEDTLGAVQAGRNMAPHLSVEVPNPEDYGHPTGNVAAYDAVSANATATGNNFANKNKAPEDLVTSDMYQRLRIQEWGALSAQDPSKRKLPELLFMIQSNLALDTNNDPRPSSEIEHQTRVIVDVVMNMHSMFERYYPDETELTIQ